MFFIPFLAIIMRGQRTVRERWEYSLTVLSNGPARDGPMFHPCLWIDAKNRLFCCETSLNIRVKHPSDVVLVPMWANVAPILRTAFLCPNFQSICDVQHFLKLPSCLIVRVLIVDGHPINFLHHFCRRHLMWLTTAMFISAITMVIFFK